MSRPFEIAVAAFALTGLAGCDGASSAREPRPTNAPGVEATAVAASSSAGTAGGFNSKPATTRAIPAATQDDGSGFLESSFDDIRFPMDKSQKFERTMLTPKAQSVLNKRIRIRGYMYPTLRSRGLTQFVLVRDNMECCFGPGAALYDCVLVTMAKGQTAEYSIRPIAVEGEFRLEELAGPQGQTLAIYQMVGEGVK